jgi:hypothetical protein
VNCGDGRTSHNLIFTTSEYAAAIGKADTAIKQIYSFVFSHDSVQTAPEKPTIPSPKIQAVRFSQFTRLHSYIPEER